MKRILMTLGLALLLVIAPLSVTPASAGPVAYSPPAYSNVWCGADHVAHFTVRPSAGNSRTRVYIYKYNSSTKQTYPQGTYDIVNYINFHYYVPFPYTVHSIYNLNGVYNHWFKGC